jgi:hypothetical protein
LPIAVDELRREALGLDELERERHLRVADHGVVLADEDLARLDDLPHRGALEVGEVQRRRRCGSSRRGTTRTRPPRCRR